MECNKDEALRAKQIAENRMQCGDFAGALKFAMKAQRLFPEIQNITQILTVCEVHCAAQNKLSASDMDWYGILLTQRFTDEATIKKQYKKLALLLHPDKNKSAGAEAAFKLIVEANRVLSDQTKRSLYNKKIRGPAVTTALKVPPHTQNSNQRDAQQTFWTSCKHCKTQYEYYKSIVNATLRCQQCSKPFTARDMGFQGAPPGNTPSSFNDRKGPQNHVPPKEASKSNGGKPHGKGPEDKFPQSCPVSMTKCTAGDGVSCKVQKSKDDHGTAGVTKAGAGTSNPATSKAKQSQTPTNVGSKRARQSASADFRDDNKAGNGNGMKDSNVQEKGVDPFVSDAGVHSRRSFRTKQHVSYTENAGGTEFESASKRPRQDESCKDIKVEKREVSSSGGLFDTTSPASFTADVAGQNGEMRNKANAQPEKTVLRNKMKVEQLNLQRKETSKLDIDDRKAKADDSLLKSNPTPDIICCPDPEFSDFDKVKKEECFADNQVWAIYGYADCMPRFYARIRKVHSPFKLEYIWLEPNPDLKDEIDWCDADLPVACGKYKLGHRQITKDVGMFSHQVRCIKSSRGSYLVYPMKGETWAIFRHWDIGWSSKQEKKSEFEFEYVKVLSDFDGIDGVKVTYLSKVKGFVSLFQQTVQNGIGLFCVPPNEMYKFSHQVPSVKMTGKEREGVPRGSFELDPAGLHKSVFQVSDPGDGKMEDGNLNNGVTSCQGFSEGKVEQALSNENIHKAKLRESNGPEIVSPIIRRSPRSNAKSMDNGHASTSEYLVRDDDKNTSSRDHGQPEGSEAAACQTNENFKTPQKHEKRNYQGEALTVRRSPRDLSKKNDIQGAGECTTDKLTDDRSNTNNNIKENVFSQSVGSDRACLKKDSRVVGSCYDFKKEKSREMFRCGQVWAIYGDGDNMPDVYVQIKKIESTSNFRLHVSELEPCSPLKGLKRTISCGSFKIKNAKPHILSLSAFSHQLNVEPMENSIYEIYPRKGEIWALYQDQNYELPSSNQGRGRGKCHLVEVLADNDKNIQVVILVRLSNSRPIFKAPIIRRSKNGIIDVSREEVGRFSHQVPAFQHSGEDDVHLRGCWVVDSSSMPCF
ncbi:uncharacterized protein [Cicer arietinum]|uniref:Uncharacterized protein LOC101488726 n=1 Tax=Cicer arietinum TaxID=3827 RepID=A0A1S2XWB7_CICAR|nr:uncharacterized protein LOC101488726 [Cicer arietinum]XP_027188355.1 uncharacterized protein LOC101488726 [Cicer arietinum]XP_027188356.1 uncharacterized protein LOC101488726 [Cicer arietinum]